MTYQKFVKRLRREVTANPKKALALAGLLLVALYFWAPLLGGWFVPGTPSVASPTAAAGRPAVPPGTGKMTGTVQTKAMAPAARPQPASAEASWQQLVQWRQEDPRCRPAQRAEGQRDPFQHESARAEKLAAAEQEKAAPPPHVWTSKELGLQLSSTIVGPQRSVALINGKPYRRGQTIELAKEGQTLALTVAEIEAERIVLTWLDQRIELTLPERDGSGRMEMATSR